MGLLSASPSSAAVGSAAAMDKPKPSTDGVVAFEAPNRNARAHCWQARDAFFECLERNSIIDSIKDAETAQRQCGEQSTLFEKECARSWVCFFFFFLSFFYFFLIFFSFFLSSSHPPALYHPYQKKKKKRTWRGSGEWGVGEYWGDGWFVWDFLK